MTGQRESVLMETIETLLAARKGEPIADLPAELVPAEIGEVYFVQDAIAEAYGDIGGWKIGAPTPEATPLFAPMPLVWMAHSGNELTGPHWRYRGLEAEIAFLVGEDLPPRATPYTREEALAAMASCHPAIEVLESAFIDPMVVTKFSALADLQMHGGFVPGPAVEGWQTIDFNAETVTLSVDGVVRVERTGSNTSGDLLKLIPWLANEGAARTGGLRKGQWITTGSWTGYTPASVNARVDVEFTHAGHVGLRFA
ncbi:2-keto-4-pentenoate hydratase [Granulicella sp. 5B5]|uniref:2-keto-4-pentenoate hydratase n=1 Tax=Granulicella sp. 5B5 TaxID=1617967 RepID=UPI0015F76B1D|nr:fumarylacetoacetate hydrolase family protein [Granulicella sp. 5B5]QMV17598.1 2-keto-4-pentenoate hydratase [Granulicella sp. 5B5]